MNFIVPTLMLGVPLVMVIMEIYQIIKVNSLDREIQTIKPVIPEMTERKREMFNLENLKIETPKRRVAK